MVTLVLFGFGVYGVFNIKLDFDSLWFMDAKSYQTSYYKSLHKNFPEHGERVEVYIGKYTSLICDKVNSNVTLNV